MTYIEETSLSELHKLDEQVFNYFLNDGGICFAKNVFTVLFTLYFWCIYIFGKCLIFFFTCACIRGVILATCLYVYHFLNGKILVY